MSVAKFTGKYKIEIDFFSVWIIIENEDSIVDCTDCTVTIFFPQNLTLKFVSWTFIEHYSSTPEITFLAVIFFIPYLMYTDGKIVE